MFSIPIAQLDPLITEVKEALWGYGVALKIMEPKGLSILKATLDNQQRQQAGPPFQVAHVYVNVDADTAQRRLMARCGGNPGPADQRRLAKAADECTMWPSLHNWSYVVDNNREEASMASLADSLLWSLVESPGGLVGGPSR